MMNVLELLDLSKSRRVPVIRQSEASECGIACLAMIAAFHGLEADMPAFRRQFTTSLRGATLKRLMEIADRVGLSCRPLRVDIEEIAEVRLPAILHWNMNHFVVLTRVKKVGKSKRYWVNDPSQGARVLSESELSRHFTGVAVELTKTAQFRPQVIKSKLKISQLWASIHGAGSAVAGVFALSAVLQLIALISPFYLQISLDTVLPAADHQLLTALAVGFGGLVLIETLTGWLRMTALLNVTSAFSFQLVNNLYRHLVSLPLSWFEKRHVGDVVSRFGSTQPVTDFISQGMVSAALDGLLAFATLILMFVYSPLLSAVALVTLILYSLVRTASFSIMRQSNTGSITAIARENSAFMETIRGISTIKAFGREAIRQRMWQSLKASAVNAQLKVGRLSAGFDAVSGLIIGGERVLFVYLSVDLAMRGGFSVGMIFAFQAYKGQFLGASTRLVDQILHYRLIDIHLTRIADIALTRSETVGAQAERVHAPKGEIEFRNVSFRYGMDDSFVLRNVDLHVSAGEMIALIGPSGGGKTTFLKIAMGLLEPTMGQVLIDGTPLSQTGLRNWRSHIGSVLQDDQLFAGSLAENIAFFDPEIQIDRVREACRSAAVLAEIEAMPLGLETLVGDMGSSLSGGQRQRIMLARALYASPAVLFMDEGTANLDPVSERSVIDALHSMPITRIISAHRAQAISAASRVYLVSEGSVRLLEK